MPVAAASLRESAPIVSFCAAAAALVGIGVEGLQPDELGAPARFGSVGAAFGFLLCGLVLVQFYWRARFGPPLAAAEVRPFSRLCSRSIYLIVYCVVGVAQLRALLRGSDLSEATPGLRGYLACTLAALATNLALTAIVRRSIQGAGVRRASMPDTPVPGRRDA